MRVLGPCRRRRSWAAGPVGVEWSWLGELGAGRRAERWKWQSELVGQRSHAVCFSQQAKGRGGYLCSRGRLAWRRRVELARSASRWVGRSARGSVESWPGGDQLAARNRNRSSSQWKQGSVFVLVRARAGQVLCAVSVCDMQSSCSHARWGLLAFGAAAGTSDSSYTVHVKQACDTTLTTASHASAMP
jgi:hypothetical protein